MVKKIVRENGICLAFFGLEKVSDNNPRKMMCESRKKRGVNNKSRENLYSNTQNYFRTSNVELTEVIHGSES